MRRRLCAMFDIAVMKTTASDLLRLMALYIDLNKLIQHHGGCKLNERFRPIAL